MNQRFTWLAALLCAALITAGCPTEEPDDDDITDDDDVADDDSASDDDDSAGECVDTAGGEFPASASEISWSPDDPEASMLDYALMPLNGYEGTYVFGGDDRLWEAVRFDIDVPTTVHGARVAWRGLPEDAPGAITLGFYDDFGSNGFDFYQWEALFEGDRCLTADDQDVWIDYVLPEPIEIDFQHILWVAHLYEDESSPAFAFATESPDCSTFHGCHSAVNFPDADPNYFYNGLSTSWHYNYSVRLVAEVHDTIPPEDTWFQVDEALSGSGQVSWGDYDHDGDDDLMTNGPTLYRNNGDGTFTDVSEEAGLNALTGSSSATIWGDYDNDGCLDFFGANSGYTSHDILVRSNCDGTFTDVTEGSGIDDTQDSTDCDGDGEPEHSPTTGAGWFDLDNDGFLDLYLANYECGGVYVNYPDFLFHNNGDGTFSDWSDHGVSASLQAGRGVSPNDVNQDGLMDMFVSNYRLDMNFMYENLGEGEIYDRALAWGLAGQWNSGSYGHTIGSVWSDFDNDGDWDIVQSNLAHPRYYSFSNKTMILRNDGDQAFEDIAVEAGMHYRETHSNVTSQDFDSDGDWDLFFTCVYEGRFSELYFNDGDSTFTQVNYPSGAIITNGWGSAAADYDNDGDMDLLAYDLFRNDTAAAGNHWLQVRAHGGVTANWSALGARVEVDAGGQTVMNQVSGGSGTGCQDSATQHFGLGAATVVDEVRVIYPGGASVTVDGPIDADQRVWVYEDGTVTYGWAP